MTKERDTDLARKGRVASMVIAGTAVFWILANLIGGFLDLTPRVRALFDLIAGAGFVFALVMIFQIWRLRNGAGQDSKG